MRDPLPENSTALNAANDKLVEMKNLNHVFTRSVISEFSRLKLPLDYVRDLGNAISLLNLNEKDLVPLMPFYMYETSMYGYFNELRDKMNVFDRQDDYFPYRNMPAVQMDNVNNLIDEVIFKTKMYTVVLHETVNGPEYQKFGQSLVSSHKDLKTQIDNLVNLAGLFKPESRNDKNITEIKDNILPEIGRIGNEMLQTIAEAKSSDWSGKIFESYEGIVNVQKDFPTKLEFSFISV